MYKKEYLRVCLTYMAGLIVALPGLLILILSALKIIYSSSPAGVTVLVYQNFAPFRWLWPWLPSGGAATSAFGDLFTIPVMLGMFLVVFGSYFTRQARQYWGLINEAARLAKIAQLQSNSKAAGNDQLIDNVRAGRDVGIYQINSAEEEITEWSRKFWQGPLGILIVGVAATVIAAGITKALGLT